MSLFFETNVMMDGEQAVQCAWSNNDFNMVLAVATNAPRIIFVNEEGSVVPDFEIQTGKNQVNLIKWHPVFQALAIGWQDGTVTLWNEDERLTREEKQAHKAPLSTITFSGDGSRMVSGDMKGTVRVWRTHIGLTPVCTYTRDGIITNIVFCSLMINADSTPDTVNSLFFFGSSAGNNNGSVCLADDLKNCSEVCKVPGNVKNILFYEKENSVIVITSHLLLVQFKLNLTEKLVPDRKVKLAVAGNPEFLNTIWAGTGLMATVSGENMIRMFNIETDENYVLTLGESAFGGALFQDKINCIQYNARKRIITGGTKNGYIVMWRCKNASAISPSSGDEWEAQAPFKSNGVGVNAIEWGGANQHVMSGVFPTGVMILNHTVLKKKMKDNFKMIQISNKAVEVRVNNEASPNQDFQIIMTLGMNIKGIDCSESHALFWNGKYAQLYDVQPAKGPQCLGSFESNANVCAITQDSVVQSNERKIEVCSYAGEVKQVIPMTEQEGDAILIEVRGKYMAVVTAHSLIKIFDISRRQFKQMGVTRKFEMVVGQKLGEIKDICLNSDGKKLVILADQKSFEVRIPDSKFYIYDIDMDKFMEFKVSKDRIPVEAYWDQQDPRLLAVETEYAKQAESVEETPNPKAVVAEIDTEDFKNKEEAELFTGKTCETFFVTTDYGIKRQDEIKFESGHETLLGVQVPYFYYMGRKVEAEDSDSEEEETKKEEETSKMLILRSPMKDFTGLESVDEVTKKAILNFSHYLTVGNMDEAYNSVRNINNKTVWQNMAQMCVKTKRLDVAMVCLGNMRFARGARATRETEGEKELEARLAMVAIQLNMIDEAKALYKECGRYDLLCKLNQVNGEFDEAVECAEKFNRINLKNTHYSMAKHYEAIGEVDMAIKFYISSNTHQREVPRMLTAMNQIDRLQQFIVGQREPALNKWWAQFLEAQDNVQEALEFYREAKDFGSCVRLLCNIGDVQNASKLALSTNDPQACFHLARYYENDGNMGEAILYYSKSQRLHHAIRLAKEHGFDQQVMTMSLISSKPIMIQSALYFERKGKNDKAVQLYSRGGNKRKGMDLALKHNLGHMLEDISAGVGEGDDPEVMKQSVDFLLQNGQYEKAVEIMISLGNNSEALELAEQRNVEIKEESVMKLIPAAGNDLNTKQIRQQTCLRIAKLIKKQGNFKLGAKIYTMANEKMKGLKCLLKSGDVKSVIGFANAARQTEVYVFAGNFLQSQNWHNSPQIMSTIISFYQKAKAWENLANFYDACAQVEIDEYRDYEKALGAMREALAQLTKSTATNKEMKETTLKRRIGYIEQFCSAREAMNGGDSATMASICEHLVDQKDVEQAIRLGDVFAQLIEHYMKQGNSQKAYDYLERMKKKKIVVTPYLDANVIENIYKGMGMAVPTSGGQSKGYDDGINEDIMDDTGDF